MLGFVVELNQGLVKSTDYFVNFSRFRPSVPICRVINPIIIHGVAKLYFGDLFAVAINILANYKIADIMRPAKN
jgi:hypothetical protein